MNTVTPVVVVTWAVAEPSDACQRADGDLSEPNHTARYPLDVQG